MIIVLNMSNKKDIFIFQGTAPGVWASMGVFSDGSYGTPAGIMFRKIIYLCSVLLIRDVDTDGSVSFWPLESGSVLMMRIRVAKNQSKSWDTRIKIDEKSTKYHIFENRNHLFTHINNKLI